MPKEDKYIERHIVIGLITSTEYLNQIRDVWDERLLQSDTARRISSWCVDYYDKYSKAPNQNIEGIYFQKLKEGMPDDVAEEIEEDILPDLSEEYEREKFNVEYLLDRTRQYFTERNLKLHSDEIQSLLDQGSITEAEKEAYDYRPLKKDIDNNINLSDPGSLERVAAAFAEPMQPILEYPGPLGSFINRQLTRDSFVAFLAPEKRGKSYMLLDMARRGVKQRLKVAFFQAGDMSEKQQLRRIGIHLAKKSDLPEYTGKMYEPVKDCVYNQLDECDLDIRESDQGLEGPRRPSSIEEIRQEMTFERLKELYESEQNADYKNCHNCSKFHHSHWGCPFLKKTDVGASLEETEAKKVFQEYFVDKKRSFILATFPNNTLSVQEIRNTLDVWYRESFVPDMIVVDYADLLVDNSNNDFRHKQDQIWKELRSVSEERHVLLVTATQADARSYDSDTLSLNNFSEDKRKLSHVTAMFGLNQDPKGREKDIGIMRLNELVLREGEFQGQVHVLQNLKRGQPVVTSYW